MTWLGESLKVFKEIYKDIKEFAHDKNWVKYLLQYDSFFRLKKKGDTPSADYDIHPKSGLTTKKSGLKATMRNSRS